MTRFILAAFILLILLSGCAAPAQVPPQAVPQGNPVEMVVTLSVPQKSETPAPTAANLPTESEALAPANPGGWIAYLGQDGNIWLISPNQGEIRQITYDAHPMHAATEEQMGVDFMNLSWSSDGRLLAFIRQTAVPYAQGMHINYHLWLFDVTDQTTRALMENVQLNGISWKPGSHQIAYGRSIENGYFSMRGGTNASLATGIWTVDADTGESAELISPERGFALVNPNWSPEGQRLSFEEVIYTEGRGNFAYYDVQEQKYVSWDKPIGAVDWAPDGSSLIYDYLIYTPSGEERIYRNSPTGDQEQGLSPDYENGYAFSPVYSPTGGWVAYLAELMDGPQSQYKLYVIPAQGGQPRELATFDQPGYLAWSADEQSLLLGVGPYGSETQQVVLVSVSDGSVRPLVKGSAPAWQPAVP